MSRPHAELLCPDLARSLRYYTQVLGAAVLDQHEDGALVGVEATILALRIADLPIVYPAGAGLTLILPVADAAALAASAQAYGARLVEPLADDSFAIMDPDGYRLRFVQS